MLQRVSKPAIKAPDPVDVHEKRPIVVDDIAQLGSSRQGQRLAKAFNAITDDRLRIAILGVAEAAAADVVREVARR